MIKILDKNDPNIANQIITLQRKSYQIEADLIGFDGIPYLTETLADLQKCKEKFLGYIMKDQLVGLCSWETISVNTKNNAGKIPTEMELTICRLVVHPQHFKKGIASKLLLITEAEINKGTILVTTAKKNKPAIKLYQKLGYTIYKNFKTKEELAMVELKKKKP